MLYMSSDCDDSGTYTLSVTFEVGTDLDMDMVKVQNQVQQATPRLPKEVTEQGVTVETRSPDMLGFLTLRSPNGTHNQLAMSDFAHNQIKNVLKRIPGVGNAMVYGPKRSMRVWLDEARLAAQRMSADDAHRGDPQLEYSGRAGRGQGGAQRRQRPADVHAQVARTPQHARGVSRNRVAGR